MSRTYISADLRQLVGERAEGLCEYCLIHEDDAYFGCQVDHIISEKHGGATEANNLAFACTFCNRFKGSDVASVAKSSGKLVRFYNPCTDVWSEHFLLEGVKIFPLTDIGSVTEFILQLNETDSCWREPSYNSSNVTHENDARASRRNPYTLTA